MAKYTKNINMTGKNANNVNNFRVNHHNPAFTAADGCRAFGLNYFMGSMILADFYYFCSNYNSNE